MKRGLSFLGIFLVVLVAAYMEPVFFPAKPIVPKNETPTTTDVAQAVPYQTLTANGFAQYIQQPATTFIADFGSPEQIETERYGYERWSYQIAQEDYLELLVVETKIASIKVFAEHEKNQPFDFGMTLLDVSKQMTIYSDFSFTFAQQAYELELTEEDMNYRPLIAFDNDSFAMLFFNYGTSKLTSIVYLDTATLLKVMPYQLLAGELPTFGLTVPEVEFSTVSVLHTLNLMRANEALPSYELGINEQAEAKQLLTTLDKEAENLLLPERYALYVASRDEQGLAEDFSLTTSEFQSLLKQRQIDPKQATGIYTAPVYDPSMLVLLWFSDSLYHSRLAHEHENERIGIAFSKASMLLLISEEIANSETEESG